MSNIIRLNETAPNSEWIVMSNQGTDCFLDLLIIAAESFEKTGTQEELISFLKDQKDVNEIAPGSAGFDLDEMPWQVETLKDDTEFLCCVITAAQNERTFRQLPYEVNTDIVLPLLRQFFVLAEQMKSETVVNEDLGSLDLSSDEVTYRYKGETYWLSSHPYEPCLYLQRGDELVCTLHNAYNTEDLVKAFTAGKTVKTNYGKDYDKEFDEAGFCRILAAALNSGCDDMDLFYAAKLAKEGVR
ncbi:MAG: hypothetical protein IKE36_01895 [Solobacterium sp.]|nr:hypothetical protein [Solobacterium sp.]